MRTTGTPPAATIVMRADEKLRTKLRDTISVFTIHNLAFQGVFDPVDYPLLGINWSYYTVDGLEFFDHVNLMKGAIMMSDAVSTVSPSYAAEATSDPDYGFGLEGVLQQQGRALSRHPQRRGLFANGIPPPTS